MCWGSLSLRSLTILVVPASVPGVVSNDADDDHVIAAAVAARAELIVTGDRKHLLPIGTHQSSPSLPRVRRSGGHAATR
jgi:predicted nucleic acid-binding protein